MKSLRAFALTALIAATSFALAWDGTGHQIVGIIAYDQLTPTEQAKLNRILNAGEPTFKVPENAPGLGLGKATTFADFLKGNNNTAYEAEITKFNDMMFPPSQRSSSNNEGTRMRVWHYINKPLHTDRNRDEIEHAPWNAVKGLNFSIKQFSLEETDRMKCFWVYWVSHIVGDLHQPLHCCASLMHSPKGDAGGNGFTLQGNARNLHSLWDNAITDAVNREGWRGGLIEKAAMIQKLHPPAHFENQVKALNPDTWVDEGASLGEKVVYVGIVKDGTESPEYRQRKIDVALKQAALSGYRLAAVLRKMLAN